MTRPDVIAAVDVGSVARGNIGWCHLADGAEQTGRRLDEIAEVVADDLNAGRRVALGFEAPLFIPLPDDEDALCKARRGEGSHAWSAAAGLGALALAAQEATYVLTRIANNVAERPTVSMEVAAFHDPGVGMVLWEAFVTGKGKDRSNPDPHVADARAAVRELVQRLEAGDVASDVDHDEVLSIIGAAVLRSGLSQDLGLLGAGCIVIKAPILS